MKFLFVADPLANFDFERETSLFIMHEAQRRGHEIFATLPSQLCARGREVYASCQKIKVLGPGKRNWYVILDRGKKNIPFFDAVLLRKDPPFDLDYLHHLYLLDLVSDKVAMMNPPRGILMANEKLWPLSVSPHVPPTLVSADRSELVKFVRQNQKGIVIKPIGSSGGRGVFLIRGKKSPNLNVILETATRNFTRHVVAQTYIKEIEKGDKRIMLLDGEILGAFLRKPASGEHRANLHAGGSLHRTSLNRNDLEIVDQLRPILKKHGLALVGLDIIGNYLIEVNVTSPMGLREVNVTSGGRSEKKVVDFLEKRVI